MVTEAQLAGYVLEELLASLLRESGYELLSSPAHDPETLLVEGNGLVVRGRGCTHQVDALGTLNTPVPFGLPLRLFMEAKHRTSDPVGIDVVRNAFGVLADVNQHCPDRAAARRVAYQYSLVSTRGFTRHAVAYARTHGIALHDFSGDAWQTVRDSVDMATRWFLPYLDAVGPQRAVPLSTLRRLLRAALATLERSDGDDDPAAEAAYDRASIAGRVRAEAARAPVVGTIERKQLNSLLPRLVRLAQRHDRSLLIGYPDGQLLLAMRPDHTRDLDEFLQGHARTSAGVVVVPVRLVFSPVRARGGHPAGEMGAGDWVVEPEVPSKGFRLRVGLPQGFERTLLTTDGAAAVAGGRTGSITIYRRGTPYRLQYELEERAGAPEDDHERPSLRAERARETAAITPEALLPEGPRGGPSPRARTAAPPVSGVVRSRSPRSPRTSELAVLAGLPAPDPVLDEACWGDDEVTALLALLQQRATAAPGKRASTARVRSRHSAEQALWLLHELAAARGELSRAEICQRLGNDPNRRFTRGTGAVTSATKTLKRRGEVPASRGDVLTSERKGRSAGSNGVTSVSVRREFIRALRAQARRAAKALPTAPEQRDTRSAAPPRSAGRVPRQRSSEPVQPYRAV